MLVLPPRHTAAFSVLVLATVFLFAADAPAQPWSDARLARAQAFLDAEQPGPALTLVEQVLEESKSNAGALLLRSTGRVLLGDISGAYKDLKRATKIDPSLRQAWLNLAGLEIAEGAYDDAAKALVKARELDSGAADSYLNLGAVAVLQNDLATAEQEFGGYLEREPKVAEAHYLIATNWAIGGQEDRAVEHLEQAIRHDERWRLQARQDERFSLLSGPAYAELLRTDGWTPPPGTHQTAAAFSMPYVRTDPKLLYAVLEALRRIGRAYEPAVEANEGWGLVWAEDLRIKVYNQPDRSGVVNLTADPASMSASDFERAAQTLFRAIYEELEKPTDPRLDLGQR